MCLSVIFQCLPKYYVPLDELHLISCQTLLNSHPRNSNRNIDTIGQLGRISLLYKRQGWPTDGHQFSNNCSKYNILQYSSKCSSSAIPTTQSDNEVPYGRLLGEGLPEWCSPTITPLCFCFLPVHYFMRCDCLRGRIQGH